MPYTFKETAAACGMPERSLRLFRREKLLPWATVAQDGTMSFTDDDIRWINMLRAMRTTGMTIPAIKEYTDLCLAGESTLHERLRLFERQSRRAHQRLEQMQECVRIIDLKRRLYAEDCAELDRSTGE